eukprot:UN08721
MKLYRMHSRNAYIVTWWHHCKRVKKHGFGQYKLTAGVSYWSCNRFYWPKRPKSSCFNCCELSRPPATIPWRRKWYGFVTE